MSNIQPEITAFQTAVYGEEVRSAMISLANKLNDEVTADTNNVSTYTADINSKITSLDNELTTVTAMQSTLNAQQTTVTQLTNDAKGYKEASDQSATNASTSATNSANKALEAEGWAVGTQGGLPVTTGSPYYENNAKYFKDQTASLSYQQADWNEDVTTQSSYINNRPFKTIGYGLTVDNNILKSNVPIATTSVAGLVCPDNDTIKITNDGKISVDGLNEIKSDLSNFVDEGYLKSRNYLEPTNNLSLVGNGLSVSYQDDGGIRIQGTPTTDYSSVIVGWIKTNGIYIMSGISGGSSTTFYMQCKTNDTTWATALYDGDSTQFTVSNDTSVRFVVRKDVAVDKVIYPMVRLSTDTDNTFEKYVPSNFEISTIKNRLSENSNWLKGRNLFNELTVAGYIDSNGNLVSTRGQLCSKDYIEVKPNTTYYFKSPMNMGLNTFNANKEIVSRFTLTANSTFTTNSSQYYLKLNLTASYGDTYNNDVCINESDSLNGTYSPYVPPNTEITSIKSALSIDVSSTITAGSNCVVEYKSAYKVGNFVNFSIAFYFTSGSTVITKSGDIYNAVIFGLKPKGTSRFIGGGRNGSTMQYIEASIDTNGNMYMYAGTSLAYFRVNGVYEV